MQYCDFEDVVLIESSFAETTRDGEGLHQVEVGLTPTKLIIATDVLRSTNKKNMLWCPWLDSDLGDFELISIYPIQYVNLSVFHRRRRHTLKAHFCNNDVRYFELGGNYYEGLWNLWCERIRFLSPDDPGSSFSETSVASSISNSTNYLTTYKVALTGSDFPQVWCHYGAEEIGKTESEITREMWINGTPHYDILLNPKPVISRTEVRMLYKKPHKGNRCSNSWSTQSTSVTLSTSKENRVHSVNRFGHGISDNCSTALCLPEEQYTVERFWNEDVNKAELIDLVTVYSQRPQPTSLLDVVETSVSMWEEAKRHRETRNDRVRHPRYYGFSSHYLFLNGLGPWHVTPGERHSIQAKRAVSAVTIHRQPAESELRLPVSRRLLSASISCDAIHINNYCDYIFSKKLKSPCQPVLYFWTPEYWYRPVSLQAAYRELHKHLQHIHRFHEYNAMNQDGSRRRRRRKSIYSPSSYKIKSPRKSEENQNKSFLKHMIKMSKSSKSSETDHCSKQESQIISHLHRMLKLEPVLTAWHFDSTTLAYQITLIDKDLFLKIPDYELGIIVWLQSSKNAPNIGALIAFSHRISCLVTTEVLREESLKVRARLITRFINVADKCHRLHNFQSCRSVLAGLQSLPVYRLHNTWKYVRLHHATKYHVFEKLCQMYRDPRLPNYQKAFFKATSNPSYLPYVGDLLAKLLGRVPETSLSTSQTLLKDRENVKHTKSLAADKKNCSDSVASKNYLPNMLRRFLSAFRIWPASDPYHSFSQSSGFHESLKILNRDFGRYDNKHSKNNENVTYVNEMSSSNLLGNLQVFFESVSPNEDLRIQRYQNVSFFLYKCQEAAANYAFCQNKLASEFLLKARYQEEKDNFFHSLCLE